MTIPAWKSQLQEASFRGVKFFVGDIETVIGRRNVLHEYPLRDTPYAEDLGKKAREFTINAYVIGDDVFTQSKRLIEAIEDNDSAGILIHPTLGLKNVIPTQCRHVFKNNEGGIEYFVLTFVEAGINKYPSTAIDTQSNSQTVVATSATQMQGSFASMFTTENFPDKLAQRAIDTLIGTASGTGGAITPFSTSLIGVITSILNKGSYFSGQTANFSSYKTQLSNFTANAPTLVADAPSLAEQVAALIAGLASVYPNNPQQQIIALIALFKMFGVGLTPIPITTPAVPVATPIRIQESINQQQLINLVGVLALIQMVNAISQIDFVSRQDALNTMGEIENLIEPTLLQLANNADDSAFNALNAARVSMVLDIKARAATLKTVVYIVNHYPIPALVLAYRQYQDATQEADIVMRNNIMNPVFVPPNTNIEILV